MALGEDVRRDRGSRGAGPSPDDRTGTFAALSDPRYRVLFAAGVLVFVAVQSQQIARGQIAYEMTGSARGLGGVFLGFGLPMLLLTPFGGVAADRLPKRTVILFAEACLVLSALWVGIADHLDVLEYWMLVGAAAVQGAGFSVFGPARVAMTAELVPAQLVGNAIVLTQLSLNSTRIVAPAAAGALIGISAIGTSGVYLITAALTVASLVLSFWLPRTQPRADRPKRSVLGEMGDGVRYVWRHPTLRPLMAVSYVLVMVGFPYMAFLPAMAQDVFDAGVSGYGVMSSVTAFGALGVTIWIAGRSRPGQAWKVQSAGAAAFSIGLVFLGLAPTFGVAIVALLVVGGAASAFQAMNNTLVLTESELEYHGRVQSLLMISFSGFGLAALPLGILADRIGLRASHVGMGTICLGAVAVYVLARRRARDQVQIEL
ncbi:MAG: MFS transporter [Acidimicrobiia bacterium]